MNNKQETNTFFQGLEKGINNIGKSTNNFYNNLLSKFRLSISFRISINYFLRLFISLITVVIVYCIGIAIIYGLYLGEKNEITVEAVRNIIELNDEEQLDLEIIHELRDVELIVFEDDNIIYDSLERVRSYRLENTYFAWDNENKEAFFGYQYNYLDETLKEYDVIIIHCLNPLISILSKILLLIIIVDLIRCVQIATGGKKAHKKVFQPIEEMTEIATRTSGNNLGERINIAGTKNELKDLARTINGMMDRLEMSYNNQRQFVSDASHELRTPISVIQGYANLLNRWGKDDKEILEESIEAIKNEAENMKDLVEKLLFLTRHDKKTLKIEKEVFEVRPLVEEMVKETRMITEGVNIIEELKSDCRIYGDSLSIKQAVRIFIDNSKKYNINNNDITIGCKIENEYCVLYVKDKGVGISKDDLAKIFERFYRADEARSDNNSHGLGLAIAKLIVQAHEGKIKVSSKLEEGSTFAIYIKRI